MALFPSAAQITPESRSTLSSPPKARQDDYPLLLFFDAEHRIHQDSEFSPSLSFFFSRNPVSIVNPCTTRGRGFRGTAQSCAKATCPVSVEGSLLGCTDQSSQIVHPALLLALRRRSCNVKKNIFAYLFLFFFFGSVFNCA